MDTGEPSTAGLGSLSAPIGDVHLATPFGSATADLLENRTVDPEIIQARVNEDAVVPQEPREEPLRSEVPEMGLIETREAPRPHTQYGIRHRVKFYERFLRWNSTGRPGRQPTIESTSDPEEDTTEQMEI